MYLKVHVLVSILIRRTYNTMYPMGKQKPRVVSVSIVLTGTLFVSYGYYFSLP